MGLFRMRWSIRSSPASRTSMSQADHAAHQRSETGGMLETAIRIFDHAYPRRYLHQLVSSQLDMDRMDYLNRDSFFTGVAKA